MNASELETLVVVQTPTSIVARRGVFGVQSDKEKRKKCEIYVEEVVVRGTNLEALRTSLENNSWYGFNCLSKGLEDAQTNAGHLEI